MIKYIFFLLFFSVFFLSSSLQNQTFAQTYRTDSNTTTNIGNPTASGTGPTNNDCGGKYATNFVNNTLFSPKNFGDPTCDFTQNKLAALLQQSSESKYWDRWYAVIVPGESGYNPNAEQLYDPVNTGHAWGLYQMARKGFGHNQYDRGDVDWRTQTSNATTYNNNLDTSSLHNTWTYWATARQWWFQKL